jgi:hypothetical protein
MERRKKWSTDISECMCRARARGVAATIDVSELGTLPGANDGISIILSISASAKAADLDLTFKNVPEHILARVEALGINDVPKFKFNIGQPDPTTE